MFHFCWNIWHLVVITHYYILIFLFFGYMWDPNNLCHLFHSEQQRRIKEIILLTYLLSADYIFRPNKDLKSTPLHFINEGTEMSRGTCSRFHTLQELKAPNLISALLDLKLILAKILLFPLSCHVGFKYMCFLPKIET